jgi:hypothetical protein
MPDNLIARQTPQRQRLAGGAGDAVGIVRGASGKADAVGFCADHSSEDLHAQVDLLNHGSFIVVDAVRDKSPALGAGKPTADRRAP